MMLRMKLDATGVFRWGRCSCRMVSGCSSQILDCGAVRRRAGILIPPHFILAIRRNPACVREFRQSRHGAAKNGRRCTNPADSIPNLAVAFFLRTTPHRGRVAGRRAGRLHERRHARSAAGAGRIEACAPQRRRSASGAASAARALPGAPRQASGVQAAPGISGGTAGQRPARRDRRAIPRHPGGDRLRRDGLGQDDPVAEDLPGARPRRRRPDRPHPAAAHRGARPTATRIAEELNTRAGARRRLQDPLHRPRQRRQPTSS